MRVGLITFWISSLLGMAVLTFPASPAFAQSFPAQPDALTIDEIENMVDALTAELLARHDRTRQWEPNPLPEGNVAQPGGRTAMVALSLIDAGIPVQEPRLLSAIQEIAKSGVRGNYALGACLMIYARLPDRYLEQAKAPLAQLLNAFSMEAGGWAYYEEPIPELIDNSVTQFAILGLADLASRGVKVPPAVFNSVRNRYLSLQGKDGGWGYTTPVEPRGSMTAAGVATITLCNKYARANTQVLRASERAVRMGIKWLDENFDSSSNPGVGDWQIQYWLFSAQRAAQATAMRTLGVHDWLCEGAAAIANGLLRRDELGDWVVNAGEYPPDSSDLAFALLFLSRGQKSIAFGLYVESDEDIDPIGLGPASEAVMDMIEQETDWSRISLLDSLDDWMRAPVIIVQGTKAAEWAKVDKDGNPSELAHRLLSYTRQGGTVIFAPRGKGRAFMKSVMTWAEKELPGRTWSKFSERNDLDRRPWHRQVSSIGNPARDYFLLLENVDPRADLSGKGRKNTTAIEVMRDCWQITTGGEPWTRRASSSERPQGAGGGTPAGSSVVVRHDGDWNHEPLAGPRASQWVSSRNTRSVEFEQKAIDDLGSPGSPQDIAWIRGANKEEAELLNLKPVEAWIASGGKVLLESVGGVGEFAIRIASRLSENGDISIVPAVKPKGISNDVAWPDTILALKNASGVIGYVSTADCSVCMLSPRTPPVGRSIGLETSCSMIESLKGIHSR